MYLVIQLYVLLATMYYNYFMVCFTTYIYITLVTTYECILVVLTELRTGGGAFLVIQCFCKKWGKTNNIKRTKD